MSEEELIEYLRQSAKELGIIESEPPMKLIEGEKRKA
jgi:Erythronolide synthase docking domain